MNLSLLAILATIGLAASITRFLRLSPLTEGMRLQLGERSPLLAKLFSCPHCLCFWFSLACAGLLARSWLEFGVLLLLGWRGAYYLNRLIDHFHRPARSRANGRRECRVCGAPWNRDFLERGGYFYCSYRCWFDYLKESRQESRRAETQLFDDDGTFVAQDFYAAGFAEIDPQRAWELLKGDEGYTYIDVRSVSEFATGHPAGAVNIPLYHRTEIDLEPNRDFLAVVQTRFSRDEKLLLGCHTEERARQAALALAGAGYTALGIVKSGYGGLRDLQNKRREKGWIELGLPVEYGSGEERSYASLISSVPRK